MLTQRQFEITFFVDTTDPYGAILVSGRVLRAAFEYVHLRHPRSELYVHEPLVGRMPATRSDAVPT